MGRPRAAERDTRTRPVDRNRSFSDRDSYDVGRTLTVSRTIPPIKDSRTERSRSVTATDSSSGARRRSPSVSNATAPFRTWNPRTISSWQCGAERWIPGSASCAKSRQVPSVSAADGDGARVGSGPRHRRAVSSGYPGRDTPPDRPSCRSSGHSGASVGGGPARGPVALTNGVPSGSSGLSGCLLK